MSIHRLSAAAVRRQKKPGRYADGGNLYLQVTKTGAKSWLFRYMINGRAREKGLGPLHTVSLAEARERAHELRKALIRGVDPLAEKRRNQAAQKRVRVFDDWVTEYLDAHEARWKNEKHRWQWENTLQRFASPVIGRLPVDEIVVHDIERLLKPIWHDKTETATRTRARVEAVLAMATVKGDRQGPNPARWKNNLDQLLPPPGEIRKVKNLAAMPYAEVPALIPAIRAQAGIAARALEFTILTAARTGETIGATWDEIDMKGAEWTVDGGRMKAGVEHSVPLPARAVEILEAMREVRSSDWVFPGWKRGMPLSNMAMMATLRRRLGVQKYTVHGFRSSFRTWVAEETNFPREVAEQALAHRLPSKVEAAYQRGDLFKKRRELMDSWAAYLERGHE